MINQKKFFTKVYVQKILEKKFQLRKNGTTVRTEIIAGITTFLTMAYIIFVNPQILCITGMDASAIFVTTAFISAFGSIMMGLLANLPIALAPAMGVNIIFSLVVVQAMNLPLQIAMGVIFWSAISLLLLTIFQIRYWIIVNIPISLRIGISSGIGLFIGMIGLKNAGILVSNAETLLSIGNLNSHNVLLGIIGFFIIVILAFYNIRSAVLISIVITTFLGWLVGDIHYHNIFSVPLNIRSIIGHIDLLGALNIQFIGMIFSFILISLFDSSGTLISVTDKIISTNRDKRSLCINRALLVDSISSILGSFIGISSITIYAESSSGISVGGRTGLTAVIVGILFLLVIFFSPLVGMIPLYVSSGSLIYISILMTSSLSRIRWEDLTESVPAFITAIMMPFSFSISTGISFGFISYGLMKICTGRKSDLNPCIIFIILLFILKIIFIDK